MAKTCPECGSENDDNAANCATCGASLVDQGVILAATAEPVPGEQPQPEDHRLAMLEPVQDEELTADLSETPGDDPAGAAAEQVTKFAPNNTTALDHDVDPVAATAPDPAPVMLVEAPTTPVAPIEELSTAPLAAAPEPVPPDETAATAPTTVLDAADNLLQALPVGALLDKRYVIKSVVQRSAGRNLYRASLRKQGGDYLIAESFDRALLAGDPDVDKRDLKHPYLVRSLDFFTYTPYGPQRFYAVTEGRAGVALSQLGLPQPAALTLNWGSQLSAALAYLHQQNVISPGATPENILIKEHEAALTNLQAARPLPDDPDQRAQEIAADISRLAETLYETITARFVATAGSGPLLDDSYPAELNKAFESALRPGDQPLTDAEWGALLTAARVALESAGPGLKLVSGRVSNVGRMRELNEDSLSVIECQVMQESASASLGVYVVADGMGGHQGGEVASAIAISSVTESLVKQFVAPQFNMDSAPPDHDQIRIWLQQAMQSANGRLHQQRATYHNDMGTTCVIALVAGPRILIANVGDSRAYIMPPAKDNGPREFRQVTVDHSLVQRLVSTGQITQDEAKYHPYRNVIYNSLGEKPQVQVDIFSERALPGARILICSDGLSTMLNDDILADVLAKHDDPQQVCEELVERANNAGGVDNITVITVYLEQA